MMQSFDFDFFPPVELVSLSDLDTSPLSFEDALRTFFIIFFLNYKYFRIKFVQIKTFKQK